MALEPNQHLEMPCFHGSPSEGSLGWWECTHFPDAGRSIAQTGLAPRRNLSLVKELGDRAAQGRAYGNLGNTHYLLGNFTEATTFHKEVSGPGAAGLGQWDRALAAAAPW